MPKKTVSDTDGEKPQEIKKKKSVRKSTTSPQEGVDSIKAAPVIVAPIVEPTVPPVEEVIQTEPVRAAVPSTMDDISPKATQTKFSQREQPDTNFLAADNYSFGLKDKQPRRDNSWIKKTVYVLGTLILLMTIVLVGMTYYSSKQLDQTEAPANNTSEDVVNEIPTQNQTMKFGIANAQGDIKAVLSSLVKNKFPDLEFNDSPAGTLPVVEADTLFIKPSAKSKAEEMLTFLANYGIKPQIQESETIQDDLVLYLVSELKNPDLSGQTAVVYNASGVTGAAKRTCDVLVGYKVSACSAVNSPSSGTGIVVQATEQSTFFILKRTAEFKNATFQAAAAEQVESIKVTLGK